MKEYYSVLDSYLSGIIIADGRIPDFITQQFEARKAQIVSEAKRAILKALTTAPPRGLPPVPGAMAMKHVTETLEGEMLGTATFYDERFRWQRWDWEGPAESISVKQLSPSYNIN